MAKRAFLIGINQYSNPQFSLNGCLNDVSSMRSVLVDLYGFGADDIKTITDAGATKDSIISGLKSLVDGASLGDNLVFCYSGHGTRIVTTDVAGHPDGKIDAIVPFEATFKSLITSQELYDIITAKVAPDVSFTAIYDCCHSGTMIRVLDFDSNGDIAITVQNRFIPLPLPPLVPMKDVLIGAYQAFSACLDNETAADVSSVPDENRPRGAFSYALHKIIRGKAGKLSISDLDVATLPLIKDVSPSHIQTPVFYATDKTRGVFS